MRVYFKRISFFVNLNLFLFLFVLYFISSFSLSHIKAEEKQVKGLSSLEINQVFDNNSNGLKSCYKRYLPSSINLTFSLSISLKIIKTGKVDKVNSVKVKGVGVHKSIETCVESNVKSWIYPEFTAPYMDIQYSRDISMGKK